MWVAACGGGGDNRSADSNMNIRDTGGGGGDTGSNAPTKVAGKMSFVLGGTGNGANAHAAVPTGSLTPNDEYIVSPRKAKITFVTMAFRDSMGNKLGGGEVNFSNCVVTYDRSLNAGATLLDCPIDIPIGEVYALDINFNKAMEVLVSDSSAGIYSDPAVSTKYSTTEPAGGAVFVPYTIMNGDPNSTTRGAQVILNAPVTIAAGSTPQIYITTDMVQTFQIKVNNDGTSLTANPGNDPVALFGGLTPGSSRYYSNSGSIESYRVGSINGFQSLRMFLDANGKPLFLSGPRTCGGGSGLAPAWSSPPIGGTIGGWLGKDAAGTVAYAVPFDNTYAAYVAYMVMADTDTVGATVSLNCKATASVPPPADNKTYGSGAPAMPSPDVMTPLTLLTM